MRDDRHGYTHEVRHNQRPRKPFEVFERQGARGGRRSDTYTGSLRYALERRDHLRATGRPAYVVDADGRRVEGMR